MLKYQSKVFIKPKIFNKNFIKVFIITTLCLFSGFSNINRTFATKDDSNSSNTSNTSDSVLTMTIPSDINLSILPTTEGKFGSESFDITVSTDNPTGYTLSMYNESSDLVNDTASATIPTLDNEVAKLDFPVNRWGYSLDDAIYKPILKETKTVLKTTDVPNDEDITTFNLATKINTEKPAGDYSNTFVFNAIANQSIFTVTWDANGGTVSPSTSDVKYDTAIGTLPTPTYDGHNFLGWFTEAEGGEEVTAETKITKDVTYYARWEEANLCDSTPSMQNIANLKNTLFDTEEQQIQLCDERDGKLYWAAKLKDGNIWMTQNLDLDVTKFKHLTPSNSDVDKDIEIDIEKYNYLDYPLYEDRGDFYYPDGASYETPVSTSSLPLDSSNWHYSLGSLYNWTVATTNMMWLELENFANTIDEYCWSLSEGIGRCFDEYYDDYFYMAVNLGLINENEAENLIAEVKSIGGASIKEADIYLFTYLYDSHGYILPNSICPKGWKLPSYEYDIGDNMWQLTDYYFDFIHEPFYGILEDNYLANEIRDTYWKYLGTFWNSGSYIGGSNSNNQDSIRCVAR